MNSGQSSKVERLIEQYDVDGIGDELVAYWTAEGDDRKSLRELADHLNVHLLKAKMRQEEISTIDSDPWNVYDALTDEESSRRYIEVQNHLERAGIDVNELESDFVTYQAIRSYVKDVRNAEYRSATDEERIENDRDTIQRLINRTASVIEGKLTNLRDTGRITLGDFRLIMDVQVYCKDCRSQISAAEILDNEGCNCEEQR